MMIGRRALAATGRANGLPVAHNTPHTISRAVAAAAATGLGRRRTRPNLEAGRAATASACHRSLGDVAAAAVDDTKHPLGPTTSSGGVGERTWTWSTPSPLRPGRGLTPALPIKRRVNLTVEEVVEAVEQQGGIDVRVIDLKGKGTGMGDAFVFCTCTTQLQMRRLSDMIVHALKKRKLKEAPGITGAEGYDCEDWMLVDCGNLMVHFMTKEARAELDLEGYWSNARPAEDSAFAKMRERGEEGLVEDTVEWEEDFGEEHERVAKLDVDIVGVDVGAFVETDRAVEIQDECLLGPNRA